MAGRLQISKEYKTAFVRTAQAQVIVLLAASMILDGGFFAATSFIAAAAYWGGLLVVVVRHPSNPTKGDMVWANVGFAIAFALTFAIGPLVLFLKGQL